MTSKALHEQPRVTPFPIHNKRVDRNPPPLLWPAAQGKKVRYAVRLSQNMRFPKRSTITEAGFRWALFNPHQKLEWGTWYWQYGTSKNGRPYRWSQTYQFEVTRSAKRGETPLAKEMLATFPNAHPRLWVLPDEMDGLNRLKRYGKHFGVQADAYINAPLPDDTQPPDKGTDAYQVFKFHRWGSKALANNMASSVQGLIPAYLLSGDDRYAKEAIRRGLHVAKWDPEGYTNPVISDFADGACMRLMAGVYDTFYGQMSEGERECLRDAMVYRAERIFREETNKIETLVFRSHFWQHLLIEFSEVAFALLHEHDDAPDWVRFVYELWVARFPLMGGKDGGWANGNSYFGTNIETLLVLPTRFKKLTGIDLFQNEWYHNSADFLLYTWPPHSRSDGFGDGTELKAHPATSHLAFMEDMARRFDDAQAAWYVKQWQKKVGENSDPLLLWHRITNENVKPRPRSPKGLPQAKCFDDVGIVSLHTNLADTSQNLMVGMRSSPYGSLLHSHQCQNAFNIFYGGESLFRNSGYYTSAGDAHSKTWYRATRGHNAVLIDGTGQPRGSENYGLMPRFLNGKHIAYALGDASQAYGDAGLVRFRRHVVLLRPHIVVVYDDLVADHEANWQWLIHGERKITTHVGEQRLRIQTQTARSQVHLLGSQRLDMEVGTVFDPPAHNWGGNKTFLGQNMDYFPDQWHVTVVPKQACDRMRFLAVFQVCDRKAGAGFGELIQSDEGILVADWCIRANLDVDQPAGFEIHHQNKRVGLASDVSTFRVGKKSYRASEASVLVEGAQVHRARDVLPQVAR